MFNIKCMPFAIGGTKGLSTATSALATQTGSFCFGGRMHGEKMKGYVALPHREHGRDIAIHRQRPLRSRALAFIMLFAGLLALSKLVFWRRQSDSSAADQAVGPLQFQPDGTFQLSIFEDLHFGEGTPPPLPSTVLCPGRRSHHEQIPGRPGVPNKTSTPSAS